MKFKEKITISQSFQRSINLQIDQSNKEILQSYICSESIEKLISSLSLHVLNKQSAFTWTGTYGSGKSSLALFVSALTSGNEELYNIAINKLSYYKKEIQQTFSSKSKRKIIPIIGSPTNPITVIAKTLNTEVSTEAILSTIDSLIKKHNGLILFIDEMGKFLEKTTLAQNDIYFFQQLAELANHSQGRFILIGILHQSFTEYSRYLPKISRDEWLKVQGRFVNLSINAVGEEQIDLIGRAIQGKNESKSISNRAEITARVIAKKRPIQEKLLAKSLQQCWPIHPVTTILLSQISRKSFGQNQRSVFSFLNSQEPLGFQFFLNQYEYEQNTLYTPFLFWDYLKGNFENLILASADAKIWIIASEAIHKTEVMCREEHTNNLVKTIATIELSKGLSGLDATEELLSTLFSSDGLKKSLKELIQCSLLRFNQYTQTYSLSESSDFNLDKELGEALKYITEVDFLKLNQLTGFIPIIAKRHYHEKGVMRWMNIRLAPVNKLLEKESSQGRSFGEFLIILPNDKSELKDIKSYYTKQLVQAKEYLQIIGIVANYEGLLVFSKELLALEWLQKNSLILRSDKIARREVEEQHSLLSEQVKQLLEKELYNIQWYRNGNEIGSLSYRSMSSLSSKLADEIFYSTPILKSELLNRDKPSSNGNKALNLLLKKMVLERGKEKLGIETFSAEGGLFKILLENTSLYIKQYNKWDFSPPEKDEKGLSKLWKQITTFLEERNNNVAIKEIYAFFEKPPFGIKKGLHTFLLTCYILSKRGHVAVYLNGTYIPDVGDIFIDYLIKPTSDIQLRYISNDKNNVQLLAYLTKTLGCNKNPKFNLKQTSSPLEIARELVYFIDSLNTWV